MNAQKIVIAVSIFILIVVVGSLVTAFGGSIGTRAPDTLRISDDSQAVCAASCVESTWNDSQTAECVATCLQYVDGALEG